MPPIRTSRNRKPPPEGFDEIEDTLLEFANKMKDGMSPMFPGQRRYCVRSSAYSLLDEFISKSQLIPLQPRMPPMKENEKTNLSGRSSE